MSNLAKPSILEVVEQYVPLRRSGKEYYGRCPFHEDKSPSFYINDDMGVFFCHGCGAKGDVIDFLMRWSGQSFVDICAHLGLQREKPYLRLVPTKTEIIAARIYQWVRDFSDRLMAALREIGQKKQLAKDFGLREEYEIFHREWLILSDLHDDLYNPDYIVEIYENREGWERILDHAE